MGESEGKSMLYLEARCLSLVRAAGSQGVQNGSISCVALALVGPGRDARGARGERARSLARSRSRLGERRDREPFGDPQDGKADGPVPAGHRLRHLGLLGDTALRQHVRGRQLRLARSRRMADDAAGLAGRRGDRAARRGERAGGPRARPRARFRRSSTSSASPRSARTRSGSRPPVWTRAICPTAIEPRTCSPATACSANGSAVSTSRAHSSGAGSATSQRQCSGCSARGSQPTTSRPRRSSPPTATSSRRSTTANDYRGPGTGYRLEGARWELLRRLPHAVDARCSAARRQPRGGDRRRGPGREGPAPTRS